ncbi:MAG: YkgJ family cysteine cluster protein [Thermoanaerobaculia bacterium]|nr:YkgJ family cysteine cluster protein [Thermoanaerobaculia bacterium]
MSLRVGMTVWDDEVEMKMTFPAGPARLESLLPVFQQVANSLVDLAEKRAAAEGRVVSCRKGCGACCRQLVPIGEIEARQIGRLVGDLPEPRRQEVRARFERARERLAEAGILSALEKREGFVEDEIAPLGLAYFHLGIPCPFLEEESCSIHADRPIICREYLVTSPAVNCADPKPGTIDQVELPGKVWTALARAGSAGPPARFIPWVPLVLAPDWAAAHPDASEPRPAEELVQSVFAELARRKGGPAPPVAGGRTG